MIRRLPTHRVLVNQSQRLRTETSSDVEVVSPKKVMRKDGSHGAALPAELYHQDRAQLEGFKFQENVMAVGLCNPPLEKIMVSAYVWTLGLGIFMMVNVMALVYVLTLGLSIFKDVYVLAPVNVLRFGLRNYVCGDAWAPLLCCATCHLGLRDHLLGLLRDHLLG